MIHMVQQYYDLNPTWRIGDKELIYGIMNLINLFQIG